MSALFQIFPDIFRGIVVLIAILWWRDLLRALFAGKELPLIMWSALGAIAATLFALSFFPQFSALHEGSAFKGAELVAMFLARFFERKAFRAREMDEETEPAQA